VEEAKLAMMNLPISQMGWAMNRKQEKKEAQSQRYKLQSKQQMPRESFEAPRDSSLQLRFIKAMGLTIV